MKILYIKKSLLRGETMFGVDSYSHLQDLDYIERVNQKARNYSETEKAALKRILSTIIEKVITKKELESSG